jgi:hypothetical protein
MGIAAALGSSLSWALPFNSFDPRSMAMGGAGVAVETTANAPFFNPALLAATSRKHKVEAALPMIGFRSFDPDDFLGSVDDLRDTADSLDSSIDRYNGNPNALALDDVAKDTRALSDGLAAVSDKPVQFEGGAGFVVGIPSKAYGAAFSASGWTAIGGVVTYEDADTLAGVAQDVEDYADFLRGAASAPSGAFVNPDGTVNIDTEETLESRAKARGILLQEFGLSLAREFKLFGTRLAAGVTPKYVNVTVFDYDEKIDDADTDDLDESTESSANFNFDLGVAHDHRNGWHSGLVLKNVLAQEYETPDKEPIQIEPQLRAGVAHHNAWSTVAFDLDLTRNDTVGFGEDCQFLTMGVEFRNWRWLQLRAGFRADLVTSDRNVLSLGSGFSAYGVHFDLALAGSENEVGVSSQLGLRF